MSATQTDPLDSPTATDQVPVGHFEVSKPALVGVIVGCVLIVLLCSSLAFFTKRRVQEHPDLYAPRPAAVGQPARSRTQGLTRAVLDTFPTITWSVPRNRGRGLNDAAGDPARIEEEIETKATSTARGVEDIALGALPQDSRYDSEKASQLGPRSISRPVSYHAEDDAEGSTALDAPATEDQDTRRLRLAASILSIRLAASTSADAVLRGEDQTGANNTGNTHPQASPRAAASDRPALSGTEDDGDESEEEMLCPICVESFEEGDLLRILPCPGRHHYHATCIDQWLLSHSVCPLCRTDFLQRPDARADEETGQVEVEEAEAGSPAELPEERETLASASASEIDGQIAATVEGNESLTDTNAGSRRPSNSPVPRSGLFAVTLEDYRARRRAMRATRNSPSGADRFRLNRNRRTRRTSAEAEEPQQLIDTIMALSGGDGHSPVPRARLSSSASRPSSSSGRIAGLFSVARRDAEERSHRASLPIVPPPMM